MVWAVEGSSVDIGVSWTCEVWWSEGIRGENAGMVTMGEDLTPEKGQGFHQTTIIVHWSILAERGGRVA